jgi:hypothetical protein
VDVEGLHGKVGEFWLLVIVGEGSSPTITKLSRKKREVRSSWVLLSNGGDEFLSRVLRA